MAACPARSWVLLSTHARPLADLSQTHCPNTILSTDVQIYLSRLAPPFPNPHLDVSKMAFLNFPLLPVPNPAFTTSGNFNSILPVVWAQNPEAIFNSSHSVTPQYQPSCRSVSWTLQLPMTPTTPDSTTTAPSCHHHLPGLLQQPCSGVNSVPENATRPRISECVLIWK